ncbi:MAG: hypothetical protein LBN21_07220 [Treponema sp.]|nr:hypothetical protein [Treponema sp.]
MNIVYYLGGAVVYAVLVDVFLVRGYPAGSRKGAYVGTVILSLILGGCLLGVSIGKNFVNTFVNNNADQVEKIIVESYPKSPLITAGYPVDELPRAIEELKKVIPKDLPAMPGDLQTFAPLLQTVYPKAVDAAITKVESKLTVVDIFAENDRITISSLVNGVKNAILSRFNRVVLYIQLAFVLIAVLYTVHCIVASVKGRKGGA